MVFPRPITEEEVRLLQTRLPGSQAVMNICARPACARPSRKVAETWKKSSTHDCLVERENPTSAVRRISLKNWHGRHLQPPWALILVPHRRFPISWQVLALSIPGWQIHQTSRAGRASRKLLCSGSDETPHTGGGPHPSLRLTAP